MEYSIKESGGIIRANAPKLYDAPVSILLTDSRRLSFPSRQRPTTDIIIYKDYINYVYATS